MIDDRERHRFEQEVDGHVAFAAYDLDGDTITFTHTIVPAELEGRGIGGALVKAALDDVRDRGLRVIPRCPFVAAWIDRHPDYRDLLA